MSWLNFPIKLPSVPETTPPASKPASGKAPAPVTPVTPAAPATPAKDSVTAIPSQGKAVSALPIGGPLSPAAEAFLAAKKPPMLVLEDKGGKIGSMIALQNHVNEGNYTDAQKQNFIKFLNEAMDAYKESDRQAPNGANIIRIMEGFVDQRGISQAQLDLILDGKFTGKDYVEMARNGINLYPI